MKNCPFCHKEDVVLSKHWKLIKDKYPVTEGHHLIVPIRHIEKLIDLNTEEKQELGEILVKTFNYIKNNFLDIEDFNIGINQGEYAGQTIQHLHFHFIPRQKGDIIDPRGGIRGVIPDKRIYL